GRRRPAAPEQKRVVAQLAAGDRVGDQRAGGAAVAEEVAGGERLVRRLLGHLLLLAARPGQREDPRASAQRKQGTPHRGTSPTSVGPSVSRNCRVAARSNFGSVASMHRKKRSREARAKRGMWNSGWYGCGRPLSASMPNTAASAAHNTVS